jgi:hypothetical protein
MNYEAVVLNGCTPTKVDSSTVSVQSGDIYIDGTEYSIPQTNLSVSAASSDYRKDLVVINTSGSPTLLNGSEAARIPSNKTGPETQQPAPPTISGQLALGELWVSTSGLESVYERRTGPISYIPKKIRRSDLTVTQFQENAGSGSAADPQNLNDNDTGTKTVFGTAVGEYVEIEFDNEHIVREYRYYGNDNHNEDGTYKIRYWDGTEWIDLNTGISTRLGSWSNWTSLTKEVITNKIRVVAPTLDSDNDRNRPFEWEMRG